MRLRWQHIFQTLFVPGRDAEAREAGGQLLELQPHFRGNLSYRLTGASRPNNCSPATLGRTRLANKREHKDFSYLPLATPQIDRAARGGLGSS
jgi:hypothetical protein